VLLYDGMRAVHQRVANDQCLVLRTLHSARSAATCTSFDMRCVLVDDLREHFENECAKVSKVLHKMQLQLLQHYPVAIAVEFSSTKIQNSNYGPR
jgi:hypothetical protein